MRRGDVVYQIASDVYYYTPSNSELGVKKTIM